MRSGVFVLATFIAPAAAQGWEEYSYPDYSFSVTFPTNPQIAFMQPACPLTLHAGPLSWST
jgi:hypothetical protein